LTSSKMSSVAFLCGMPQGAAGPESGVEIPNLMTSAAREGAEVATTSATAAKSATKTSGTRRFMAITPSVPSEFLGGSESQVRLFHALVAQEVLRLPLHHQLPGLQHVAVLGERQGQHRVLLDQDDGDIERVDLADDLADLRGHDGRQAHRGLVQEQELGTAHEGARDGQHLLLPATHGAGELAAALLQDWKVLVDHRQGGRHVRAR